MTEENKEENKTAREIVKEVLEKKKVDRITVSERKVFFSSGKSREGSYVITLPRGFCEEHGIEPGDLLTIYANDILIASPKKKKSLEKLKEALEILIKEGEAIELREE